jgi:hypothetical protein
MNLKYGTIGFLGVIIFGSLMLSQLGMTEGMESPEEEQKKREEEEAAAAAAEE